jgi:hypothetical protein
MKKATAPATALDALAASSYSKTRVRLKPGTGVTVIGVVATQERTSVWHRVKR